VVADLSQAQRERIAYLELKAYFAGELRRADIEERFGVKPAAATRDLTAYRQLAPENLSYDVLARCYRPAKSFKPVFEFSPERVLAWLLHGFGDGLDLKLRKAAPCEGPGNLVRPDLSILATVTRAMCAKRALKVNYLSLSSGAASRELVPVALADNGLRWHVRAFDRSKSRFGDFVLSRITKATELPGSVEEHELLGADEQWARIVDLELVPHPGVAWPKAVDRLQYLNSASNRYWFDIRPNLRREMEDRKRRFDLREDVYPFIKDKLRFATGVFGGVHVFTPSADVPDDWSLRLVVLPPEATFGRAAQAPAVDAATAILKSRGEQPRQKQNRLVFLAPDADSVSRLKDQVTSVLAWASIVADVKDGRLNLDQHQSKQASVSLEQANDAMGRMVRETYKWLLAPLQEAKPGKGIGDIQWDHFQINPAAVNRTEEIEKVLKEHELLIAEWAPVHLAKMMNAWFWKDDATAVSALDTWQKTCCYLYLPRLRDAETLRAAVNAGVSSRDFFGVAYGREEDRFQGFHFSENTTVILDDSLLLIEPKVAAEFAAKLSQEAAEREAAIKGSESGEGAGGASGGSGSGSSAGGGSTGSGTGAGTGSGSGGSTTGSGGGATGSGSGGGAATKKTTFFGTLDLNPNQAKVQFSDVADEVLMLLNKSGVKLRISVEIEAELPAGFDDGVQRSVRENCNQLKFKNHEFGE